MVCYGGAMGTLLEAMGARWESYGELWGCHGNAIAIFGRLCESYWAR